MSAPNGTSEPRASVASTTTARERPALSASGYIGRRGIVGTLRADDSRWRATFHFVDGGTEIVREGNAAALPSDPAWEEERRLRGLKVHEYLGCSLEEGGGASGTIGEARCLREPLPGRNAQELLEIDGEWFTDSGSEPFYFRTIGENSIENSSYLAALLATPTPKHDCAPFVELVSADERPARTTLAYTLHWPCDPAEEQDPNAPQARPRPARPPSHEAYVAEVLSDEPHPLLWSVKWTTLPDPDELTEVELGLAVIPLDPARLLYAGRVKDEFQSPNTGSGNSGEHLSLWLTNSEGRHGPPLEIVTSDAGSAGWCMSWNKTNSAALLDLDGDRFPELVIRRDEAERHDVMGRNGSPDCLDSPSKTSFFAYRLNAQTLTWTRFPVRSLTEQQFDRGTLLP